MSPQFLPTSYNGGDVSGGCTMYILCEETKCCRNPEKWSAEYYMVKNVWDNLIIYTTPYISYTKYISPWKKSLKRHEQMTSPLMPNTCTERGHEAQYKKWRAGWCALMKIIYFYWEDFWHRGILYWNHLRSKKERVSFIETFFDKVEEMVIAGNICQRPQSTQGASFPTPC